MARIKKTVTITMLPTVQDKANKAALKLFGTNRKLSAYIEYIILNVDAESTLIKYAIDTLPPVVAVETIKEILVLNK
jgi:hypothetical protein